MKIGLLTQEYQSAEQRYGGVGRAFEKMAAWLADRGHHVTVYLQGRVSSETRESNGVVVVRVAPVSRLHWRLQPWIRRLPPFLRGMLWHADLNRAMVSRILADAQRGRMDVVLANRGVTAPSLFHRRLLPSVIRVQHSMPKALRVEKQSVRLLDRWLHLAEQRSQRAADALFCPSHAVASYVAAQLGREVPVIPTPMFIPSRAAVSWDDLQERFQLPPQYLMYWGSFLFCKGVDILVDALPAFLEVCPDHGVVLVGGQKYDDPLHDRLVQRIHALREEHQGRIRVLEGLDHDQLFPMIEHAVAAVLPSVFDNLPNTLLEAMWLGCPVIGTRGASHDEIVEDGVDGLLVEMGDHKGLSRAMIKLASLSAEERETLGRAGAAKVRQYCDPDSVMTRIVEQCETAIRRYRRSHGGG